LGVLYLALPLPLFFSFEDFCAVVDWKTFNSEVLLGFFGVFEGGEGAVAEEDLCFIVVEEELLEV